MRIVRLANFVTERSGGLRTALARLGEGYAARGHEPVLIVPGPGHADELTAHGRVVTLPGPVVPGTGGYRVLLDRPAVTGLLDGLAPDRLEVSDRTTLRWTGRWARAAGVPSVMVSHESLGGLLALARTPARRPLADALNARTAASYDRVVCTTAWAAAEFGRIGAANLARVPLGVDLDAFHPARRDVRLRAAYAREGEALLVLCSRLSPEKRPDLALDAAAALADRGVPAVLAVVGDGPRRVALQRRARAAGLPVRFTGYLPGQEAVAALLASADRVRHGCADRLPARSGADVPPTGRARTPAGAPDRRRQRAGPRGGHPARRGAPAHPRPAVGVRPSHVEHRPAASGRAWSPVARRRRLRRPGGPRFPGRSPAVAGADERTADHGGPGAVDGDPRHSLAAGPQHRPGARPCRVGPHRVVVGGAGPVRGAWRSGWRRRASGDRGCARSSPRRCR
jgi:alpha-1,6-mannosyltransferase